MSLLYLNNGSDISNSLIFVKLCITHMKPYMQEFSITSKNLLNYVLEMYNNASIQD